MTKAVELRKSDFWTIVVLYGLALAALVFILKYFEYRYWIRDLRMEVYIGVVAVLFTTLGIWVGSMLLRGKKGMVTVAPPKVDEEVLRRIGISGRELDSVAIDGHGQLEPGDRGQTVHLIAHGEVAFIELVREAGGETAYRSRP